MRLTGVRASLPCVVLAAALASCSGDPRPYGSGDAATERPTKARQTATVEPPPQHDPTGPPRLVPGDGAHVAPDLEKLAKAFVRYAAGDSDTFPHWESVSMGLGGQVVLSIDDIAAALSNRRIWRICPSDWQVYGAASCPVDLLAPITNAAVNDTKLVYTSQYDEVTCAPARTGPLPSGRLVVIRPTPEWRTCASDFALALAANEQGELLSIDLTLSEP